MSNKSTWRGLVAAGALILTTPSAFSQEPVFARTARLQNAPPEDNLMVFDSAAQPAPIVCFGKFCLPPDCPSPPGGHPPFMPPGGPHFGTQFMMPMPPFANVDLTDEQVTSIAKLKRAFDTGNNTQLTTLRALEGDMRDKLSVDNINELAVRKLAEEIAQQKADISKRFSAHMLDVAKVMTAEQRRKIKLAQDRMELGPMGGFGKPAHMNMPPHPPEPPEPPHSPQPSK